MIQGLIRFIAFGMPILVFSFPMVVASTIGALAPSPLSGFVGVLGVLVGALLLISSSTIERIIKTRMGGRRETEHGATLIAAIVGLSMRQACALVGLVMSILSHQLFWCVVLGVPAFISLLSYAARLKRPV